MVVAQGASPADVTRAMQRKPARAKKQRQQRQPRQLAEPLTLARGFANEVASTGLGAIAGRYLGGNPTGWRRLWCGNFMRLVVRQAGLPDLPSGNVARSWAGYGHPSGAVPGAIGVMRGHVGIVIGRCAGGVLLRSGNHNRRVGDGCYALGRFIAFRSA